MIPMRYILEWKEFAPWIDNSQVEQDLIMHRTIIELFSNKFLKSKLAFRGGTALYKLFMDRPVRYSEDIDLVQIKSEPIGDILTEIKKTINYFEEKPKVKVKANNHNIIFRFVTETEPFTTKKLKIEINSREHFSVLGYRERELKLSNGWCNKSAIVNTFCLEELLATKLRALYQRKKGRDLFDLYYVLRNREVDVEKIIFCFKKYMEHDGNNITKKDFIKNLDNKLNDADFIGDIYALLVPNIQYNCSEAYFYIKKNLLNFL
ncbi:nucleotidyl transferase AbiEii/AbiGii toxin family protein [Deferribacter abyssi]|uniref:nucleotidyl transferase AbiEii/AbiGii toxin family protein n=1 Tax=Deferribacter abyssi TaxID=213806 RepID=UPI003C172536